MLDFLKDLPIEVKIEIFPALKLIQEHRILSLAAKYAQERVVNERMDFDDESALVKEIRELRQTTRTLMALEESIKLFMEGNTSEKD